MFVKAESLQARPKKFPGLWLSVSKVKSFQQCPAKYRYCYIENLPRKVWDHHVFGTFAHAVLEFFHQKIIDGRKEEWHELMTESFKEAIKDSKTPVSKAQKDEAWKMLNKYLIKVTKEHEDGSLPEVIDVEAKFYIDIDNKVLLNGLIDRIQIDPDGVLHVSDYKTTKNKKYLIGDYFQLMTYAYVMCLNDPGLKKVRTSYMLLRHNFSAIEKEYKRDQIMKMGEEFIDHAKTIGSEKLWRPKPSGLCRFCDYLSECKTGREMVDGNSYMASKTSTTFGESDW
jgi:RecB family exonuclease